MTRALAAALCLAVLSGCGPHPLEGGHPSAQSLAEGVLDALRHGDRARLAALAVNEAEFMRRVWPELPVARPERNMPADYVWSELRQKSDRWAKRLVSTYQGEELTLESLYFDGKATTYGNYVIHPQAVFTVRDAAGESHSLRVIGSMIEADGRWKVFSYIADD